MISVTGCQKEIVDRPAPFIKDDKFAKTVKSNYDLVKAVNGGRPAERTGMSLTLDEALEQVSQLFSYTYGDYSIATDSTYTFRDTITINFGAIPIETTDFVSLTNQVMATCHSQYDRISYTGPKYFYMVYLKTLSSSSTSASIAVKSVFGSKYNYNVDYTPIGQWPKNVFPQKYLAYSDYVTCANLDNPQNENQFQAPYHMALYINKYKSYLNHDPAYLLEYGAPNPNINFELVLGNVLNLAGKSEYVYEQDSHRYYSPSNYWDTLLHQTNPTDVTAEDCVKDLNCWKFSNLNSLSNVDRPVNCVISAASKCLGTTELDYYYDRFMTMILDTKNHYNRQTFISIANDAAKGICIDSYCSYWWQFTIHIGNFYAVPTKPEDKLIFPDPIN